MYMQRIPYTCIAISVLKPFPITIRYKIRWFISCGTLTLKCSVNKIESLISIQRNILLVQSPYTVLSSVKNTCTASHIFGQSF